MVALDQGDYGTNFPVQKFFIVMFMYFFADFIENEAKRRGSEQHNIYTYM